MSRRRVDQILDGGTRAAAAVSASIVLLVFAFLLKESWPALRRLGAARFVADASWHPLSDQYLLVPMMAATALTAAGALLAAAPLGIAVAVFGRFYAPPRLARGHRRLVELLAGIPSVVYGLWGLVVLVPLLSRLGGSGQGLLAATCILALMIVPTVALTADAALGAVPADQIRAAAALGFGRWAVVRRVALPAAAGGIRAGLMLATARALGETMAVLMVAGNVVQLPGTLLSPVRTLTANIALEMGYATSAHRSVLFVSGLLLLSAVGLSVVLAECFRERDDVG